MFPAWSYFFERDGKTIHGLSPTELYQEITPIVVNDLMYLPSGDRVVTHDPENGNEIWSYELPDGLASFRGVGYWPGDVSNPLRIIFTSSRKMIGLNAKTGRIDPGFGREGEVPLTVPFDGTPIVYKNLLLIGTNFYGLCEHHIGPQLEQSGGQLADVHGYDVRTGKQLWEFHTIPRPGEPGSEKWLRPDSWKNRTGNNVWAFALTLDERRGILYLARQRIRRVYGGDRPRVNLFGNTLVAVDALTGKLKWYFQNVRHELWDYNLPPHPASSIKKDGKRFRHWCKLQIRIHIHSGPCHRKARIWRGGPAGRAGRRSWQMVRTYSAVSPQAPPLSRVSFTKDDLA